LGRSPYTEDTVEPDRYLAVPFADSKADTNANKKKNNTAGRTILGHEFDNQTWSANADNGADAAADDRADTDADTDANDRSAVAPSNAVADKDAYGRPDTDANGRADSNAVA